MIRNILLAGFVILVYLTLSISCSDQVIDISSPTVSGSTPAGYTLPPPTVLPAQQASQPVSTLTLTPLVTLTVTLPPTTTPTLLEVSPTSSISTSTSTLTPISTVTPSLETTTGATFTYTFSPAVSIQYPDEWNIEAPSGGNNSVVFEPTQQIGHKVIFEVYHRPLEARSIADPHNWIPNEGGYEILWEKPIVIEEAQGTMFVWGSLGKDSAGYWNTPSFLEAIYYSETYELDIRLTTSLDNDSLMMAETRGFTETITQRFQTFERMTNSVRIITSE